MSSSNLQITDSKTVTDNAAVLDAAKALLSAAGFNTTDVDVALDAITTAKEQSPNKEKGEKVFWLDKTLVYEDNDAFIYRRATSKSGRWYLRIYDGISNKPIVRSLKTVDKVKALATARVLYIDIKGKIERGEKLKQITAEELIQKYWKMLEEKVSDVPMTGITPDHFKVKKYHLRTWREYLTELGVINKSIDKIDPISTQNFGIWLRNKPKQTCKHKVGRSAEVINDTISEIVRMYHQVAVKHRYISENKIPIIDRINQPVDDAFKRDILTEEQYEKFWKYMQHKYISKKHNPRLTTSGKRGLDELEKRKIFKEFILIIAGVGFRSKELLGIRMNELSENENWDRDKRKTSIVMKVRQDNSKTGKSRLCVAPVKHRIERIKESYKKLGIKHRPDDYLFINPNQVNLDGERDHYGRMIMYQRLRKVLEDSGLQEEFDEEGKSVSIYSFRHQYAAWRLRYGNVPIHLLAKQMGTSVSKIESTYGHIMVVEEADKITKGQEILRKSEYIIDLPEVLEDIPLDKILNAKERRRRKKDEQ